MNIKDNELSVIVPKVKWHQMEQGLSDSEKLIENLLVPSDNIVVVKVSKGEGCVMDHHYRWETVNYSEFDIKGGGEIIQGILKTHKYDYENLLKRTDYSRHMKEDIHIPKVDEKGLKDRINELEKRLKCGDKRRLIGLSIGLSIGFIISLFL